MVLNKACGDFWRMVLEQKIEAIVMLTSFKEGNKPKCAEYFPRLHEFHNYDDIMVKCTEEFVFNTYKKRILEIEKGNDVIHVTHYHFQKWLDHDCPKYPMDLIKFVKAVRADRKVFNTPVVVHCRWRFLFQSFNKILFIQDFFFNTVLVLVVLVRS